MFVHRSGRNVRRLQSANHLDCLASEMRLCAGLKPSRVPVEVRLICGVPRSLEHRTSLRSVCRQAAREALEIKKPLNWSTVPDRISLRSSPMSDLKTTLREISRIRRPELRTDQYDRCPHWRSKRDHPLAWSAARFLSLRDSSIRVPRIE